MEDYLKMYLLLKMVIFLCYVTVYQSVPKTIKNPTLSICHRKQPPKCSSEAAMIRYIRHEIWWLADGSVDSLGRYLGQWWILAFRLIKVHYGSSVVWFCHLFFLAFFEEHFFDIQQNRDIQIYPSDSQYWKLIDLIWFDSFIWVCLNISIHPWCFWFNFTVVHCFMPRSAD